MLRFLPTAPTSMPANVHVSARGSNFFTFGWDSIPCESRGGNIVFEYELMLDDNTNNDDRTGTTTNDIARVTFNNLVCFSGYTFRVRAKTGANGAGPWKEGNTFGTSLTGTSYMKSREYGYKHVVRISNFVLEITPDAHPVTTA